MWVERSIMPNGRLDNVGRAAVCDCGILWIFSYFFFKLKKGFKEGYLTIPVIV